MGAAAGYTSQYGYELYDTSGTTEDDTYAATGGFGYTIEMGPPDGNFHMPYETGVVAEWTGANPHSNNRGGLKEALLIAAGAAADPADHAILTRHRARRQGPAAAQGVRDEDEPVVREGHRARAEHRGAASGLGALCLTGQQPPLTLNDTLDATTTVPAERDVRVARRPVHAAVRAAGRPEGGLRR